MPNADLHAALRDDLARREAVLVAFSGGVDSAVVAALAHEALGPRALAVTAAGESLAARELERARRVAAEIGIRHEVVDLSELAEPGFVANGADRCYFCQRGRMQAMIERARRDAIPWVCDGTNASDSGDDRPGLRAIRQLGVYSPLLAHGADKAAVRALARRLGLTVWDEPANACLSSRIPHGIAVDLVRLRRIERAEDLLHARGFRVVRVRHDLDGARVEVGAGELDRLRAEWPEIEPALVECGFEAAAWDPSGYRTGGADRPAPRRHETGGTSVGRPRHETGGTSVGVGSRPHETAGTSPEGGPLVVVP